MIVKVFKTLDKWVTKANSEMREQGLTTTKPFSIKILGQTALIEAHLKLELFATADVDVYANYEFMVKQEFERLLKKEGKVLDKFSDEIWMPEETEYELIYEGVNFKGYLAKPEYILISKALKAPVKNRELILNYIAQRPSDLFMKLAEKYNLNLDEYV
jgi:hypothetical protein